MLSLDDLYDNRLATFIDMLLELLPEASHRRIKYQNLFPHILPLLDFIHLLDTAIVINPLQSLIVPVPNVPFVLINIH